MMKKYYLLVLISFLNFTPLSEAKVYIDINDVSSQKFPIAIVAPQPEKGRTLYNDGTGDLIAKTIQSDLRLLGLFRFIDKKAFLEKPSARTFTIKDIDFAKWAILDTLGLVKGTYKTTIGSEIEVHLRFFDVLGKSRLISKKYRARKKDVKIIAHRFANEIVEKLTGKAGIFDTKIAFVCKPRRKKELCVMNFDGSDMDQLTRDRSIVLSPAWSPDGKSIFYTSFANKKCPSYLSLQPCCSETKAFSQTTRNDHWTECSPFSSLFWLQHSQKMAIQSYIF